MLAAVLVLCVPPNAAFSGARDASAVLAVLERAADAPAADDLAARLAALGQAAIPDLFAVLAHGPGPERTLAPLEEMALVDALGSIGGSPLRAFLQRRLSGEPGSEERLAALRVLARAGTSEDLTLLRDAAEGAVSALDGALREACAGVLARDPRALEALRRWALVAPLEQALAIVRGIADGAPPEALGALAASLGYCPDLEPEILAGIARLAGPARKPLDDEVLRPVVGALAGDDPLVLRGAALVLGHAQDARALPRLITLLEHEHRGVRAAAEWALEHVTGLRFRTDVRRWKAWLRGEVAWFAREGERLRADLRAPAPEIVLRALGELSGHRWRRHELALAAGVALEHRSAAVRRLACTVLVRLGSSAAEALLREALEDPDESVASAARDALQALGLAAGGDGAAEGDGAFPASPSSPAASQPTKRAGSP